MKRLKPILIIAISSFLVAGIIPMTSFAERIPKDTVAKIGQVKPMWEENAKISLHLRLDGKKATSRVNIVGTKNTTRISADIILEKREGSSYKRVVTWSGVNVNSNIFSEVKTYSAENGSYRLRVIAKIYEGSDYYTISESTTASY